MAPSAILLAGAGAAAAILGGFPLLAVAGRGRARVPARRVAMLSPRRRGVPHRSDEIADPWRSFVREALDAQRRYRKAVERATPGPLRDSLVEIGERIDEGVDECWRIADAATRSSTRSATSTRCRPARISRRPSGQRTRTPGDAQDETVKALQAQVDSADRLINVARDAQDKLRLLDARLDEAVARAVELSIRPTTSASSAGSVATSTAW